MDQRQHPTMAPHMTKPLRPCNTCRTPVPAGICPQHPPTSRQYRPHRTSHTIYRDPAYRILRPAILLRDEGLCRYCGSRGGTVDHVIPISRGGTHHTGNMLGACEPCNTSKGNRTLLEWLATGIAPVGARILLSQRQAEGLPC